MGCVILTANLTFYFYFESEKSGPQVKLKITHVVEGNQNMPPQNIPIWDKDYFELKAIENQQIQEEFSAFLLSA